MDSDIFRNKKPDFDRLLRFGFCRENAHYAYRTPIAGGQFEMTVLISENGTIKTKVIDNDSKEEYVLHRVPESSGSFVVMVRNAHDDVLREIADSCFDTVIFKSSCAQELIQYVRTTYGEELEFLWPKTPNNAIWRRKDTKKWFGALLAVSGEKLGLNSSDMVEIIDLRIPPQEMEALIDNRKYFPGYHMNKKHWFTMLLDGSVPVAEICKRLDISYLLARK